MDRNRVAVVAMVSSQIRTRATNGYRKESGLPPLPWSNWGVEPTSHAERWTRRMLNRDL